MPYRLAYSPILRRHFLNRGFVLSDDSSLCQVDIKLVSTWEGGLWTGAQSEAPLHQDRSLGDLGGAGAL